MEFLNLFIFFSFYFKISLLLRLLLGRVESENLTLFDEVNVISGKKLVRTLSFTAALPLTVLLFSALKNL